MLAAPERIRESTIAEQERDEPAARIGRVAVDGGAPLQRHPARGQRRRRDAQQQHPRLFQPLIHFQRDDVPRLDDPLIQPQPESGFHLHPRRLQPLRQPPHPRLVLRVVTQENVELEFVGNHSFTGFRKTPWSWAKQARHLALMAGKCEQRPARFWGKREPSGMNAALTQLAEKADLSRRYLQEIESGAKLPTVLKLAKLREALGCTWDGLLKGL